VKPVISQGHWSKLSERGSAAGLRFCGACYRVLGRKITCWLLVPVVAYFFLTAPSARRASGKYLERLRNRYPDAKNLPPAGSRTVFRHLMSFAEACVDKLAAWLGDIDLQHIDFPNQAAFESLVASGRGAVLISAHIGNLELARALAKHHRLVTINAVVYTKHAAKFQSLLAACHPEFAINLLHVSDFGPETGLLLKERVDRGELIVIVGDRTPPADHGRRVCSVDFLGHPAPFAQGPFILSSVLECPVYLFFCLRESDGFRIHFEHFTDHVRLPRGNRLNAVQPLIQQFSERLEYFCLRAPLQWFNFYDYWAFDTPQNGPAQQDFQTEKHAPKR
jgi:predicted LPLAT superfamily acyltransferase